VASEITIKPIGFIRSEIKNTEDAPLFYTEDAPSAVVEMLPEFLDGLHRIKTGDEIIVITWLHRAERDVLKVHPRGDKSNPLTGVFLTRSPDRPNPLGLHRVRVLSINSNRIIIDAIEAIDETPVVDIKRVVEEANDY
jgi:tRNA-Thr(GGU) m(6)t(6)A37 methyltransferase TsaA